MNIVIRKNYEELSQEVAAYVLREMKEKPDCTLGLATGNTPLRLYSLLGEMREKENIDFSSIYTANIEEYWGVSRESEKSFYHYMEKNLFSRIGLPADHTIFPDNMGMDMKGACKAYDDVKIDLLILGIGGDGHIGFHGPAKTWRRKTSIFTLDHSIALGFEGFMRAEKIVLMASGTGKAEVVKKLVDGDITPKIPASILTLHSDITLLLDEEAASLL